MSYAADVIIILIAFALFGYTHSLLASNKLKRIAAAKFGSLIAFYRLIYNFISFISLYILYLLLPQPNLLIYDLPNPWDLIILIPQILSIIGIVWSARYFNLWEFIGFSQIKRWIEGSYDIKELDEKYSFRIDGPYKLTRHPVYLFSITFLLFRPAMDLFYLVIFILIVVYFYIGSVYEEKKLTELFGEDYSRYKEEVPRIIPFLKAGWNK
jgi:methanethiol S-methyltransferase